MATTDTAAPRTELAAHAWAHLGAVFMVQRDVWLAAAQAEELSPPQALALMRLRPEGTYSLGDLARCLRCDASQMTANADRLEERGFAERRTSAEDRRVKVLMPTPAGVEAQARLRAAFRTPPPAFADLPAEDLAALPGSPTAWSPASTRTPRPSSACPRGRQGPATPRRRPGRPPPPPGRPRPNPEAAEPPGGRCGRGRRG
ncbi:MAG: MarR family transcriptional regulator, partial [Miltoncostaeaceae bacterium]